MPIRMRKSIVLLSIFFVLFGANHLASETHHPTALSVTLSDAKIRHSTLSFSWQLRNNSNESIYVYSTFLYGPAVETPKNESGVIKVRTSLKTALPGGVNGYPDAKFLRLYPDAVITGKFVEKDLDRATRMGAKSVELEVAFGREIEKLKQKISRTSWNGEHPANPIVAWQTEAVGVTALSH